MNDSSVQPPHAFAAEQALLGALMLNGDLWNDIEGDIAEDDFYDARHRSIFRTLENMRQKFHVDPILLAQQLKDTDQLKEAGGEEYVAELAGIGAVEINIPHYIKLIRKQAMLRRMLLMLSESHAQILHPGTLQPEDILDGIATRINELEDRLENNINMQSASVKSREFFDRLSEIISTKSFDKLLGVPTGFSTLDDMTTGLHGGDLMIIAGRPGAGKTAFALNLIRHISAIGHGVVIFSLEMLAEQLVMRLLSQGGIDLQKLRTGKDRKKNIINGDDIRLFTSAVSELENRHIYIDDAGLLNVLEIKRRARLLAKQLKKQKVKLSLIVVDYLQLLSASPSEASDVRALEVGAISRGLKALAKELNVPIVALSQLNRSVETRTNKEPLLSDLRESGSIEQDADIVIFLYEDKSDRADEGSFDSPPEGVPIRLIIGKHRNGPVGKIELNFHKHFSKFAELSKKTYSDGQGDDWYTGG